MKFIVNYLLHCSAMFYIPFINKELVIRVISLFNNYEDLTAFMNHRLVMAILETGSTMVKQYVEELIDRIGIEDGSVRLNKEGNLQLGYPCCRHSIPVHRNRFCVDVSVV